MLPARARVPLAYAGAALAWGCSFLFIKVALTAFGPAQVAVGRMLLGALTLGLLMTVTRTRWPRERWLWGHLVVVGALICVAPFLLFARAGEDLPSGLSAILNATTPIWTALAVTASVRSERLTAGQVVGVVLGAAGVAVVTGLWRVVADPGFAASLPAQAACLAATACYGTGFAYLRRFVTGRHPHGPLTVAAGQVGCAAVLGLLLAAVLRLRPWGSGVSVSAVVCLVLLGALGTGMAYVWNTRVLMAWGSLAASSVTYLTPLVGVVAGVVVLGERLTWNEPVGALVVVLSVLLVQRRPLPRWRRAV